MAGGGGHAADEIATRIADAGLATCEVDCIGCWLPSHRDEPAGVPFAELRTLTPERVIAAAARVGAPSVVVVEMMGTTPPSLDEAPKRSRASANEALQSRRHGIQARIHGALL